MMGPCQELANRLLLGPNVPNGLKLESFVVKQDALGKVAFHQHAELVLGFPAHLHGGWVPQHFCVPFCLGDGVQQLIFDAGVAGSAHVGKSSSSSTSSP